jgi:hypothetical protein
LKHFILAFTVCLDLNNNGVCDADETPETSASIASSTTTLAGLGYQTTTTQVGPVEPATNLDFTQITLSGHLVEDVDPVLTHDSSLFCIPTQSGSSSQVDIIEAGSNALSGSVKLTGELTPGNDFIVLSDSKTGAIPTRSGINGLLHIIDVRAINLIKSIALAGEPAVDVDVIITPDEKNALMPTRQDASNSFLEIIDLASNTIRHKIILQGDFEQAVDCIVSGDSSKAIMPANKAGVGANMHFIGIKDGRLLKVLGVEGQLEKDVDGKITSDDEYLLMPTKTATRGFITLIDADAMAIKARVELSGTLMQGVDLYFLPGEGEAFMPVTKGNQGFVDIIDVKGKRLRYSIRLSGDLVGGVDGVKTPDGGKILMPNQLGNTGYVDIIDASTGKRTASIKLSGALMESVDLQISEDGGTAYMPVRRPGRGKVDVIDIESAKIIKTIELKADLVEDVDAIMTKDANIILIPSSKQTGYASLITGIPSDSLTVMSTGMGDGFVDVIDMGTNTVYGSMRLPGNIVRGVDGIGDKMAKTTPDPDEDTIISPTTQSHATTTTTIGIPVSTTTTTSSTSTTVYSPPQTPVTATTLQDMVITPRCGDGYLSWHGSPGGGDEECDPNTGPGNNWGGAMAYDCPPGLTCVNCKCVGCGDGRLQSGEQCDPNNRRATVNGQPLWSGQVRSCPGQYEMCDADCQCVPSVECGQSLYETDDCDSACELECEVCRQYQGYPCYECAKRECTQIQSSKTLYSLTQCQSNCPADTGLCVKSAECGHCYYCKAFECGNGVLEPGEQCESDSQCPDYHTCNNCQCITDCGSYCASVGQGFTNYAGIQDSTGCGGGDGTGSKLQQVMGAPETCYAKCGRGYFMDGLSDTCCCIKTNKVPCIDCPGQNPDCDTALAQCMASIPM